MDGISEIKKLASFFQMSVSHHLILQRPNQKLHSLLALEPSHPLHVISKLNSQPTQRRRALLAGFLRFSV